MKTIWNICLKEQRVRYSFLLVLSITAGLITALQPLLTGQALHAFSVDEWSVARQLIFLLVLTFLVDALVQFTLAVLSAKIGGRCGVKLRDRTTSKAAYSQLGIEGVLETGEIQNRILIDSALAPYTLVNAVPTALRASTLLLCCIIGMANTSLYLFFIVLSVVVLTGVVVRINSRWIKKVNHRTRAASAAYGAAIWHLLDSLRVHKSRNGEELVLQRAAKKSEELRKTGTTTDIAMGFVSPTVSLGTQVALVLSIGGAMWLMKSDALNTGDAVTFVMFMLYCIAPVVELGTLVPGKAQADVAKARLEEVWNQFPERSGGGVVPKSERPSLRCEGVSYRFPGMGSNVIDSIDINIQGPGLYLVKGPNGAGKSTLLYLLNGVFPSEGEIYINGVKSSEISIKSWRETVLLVDQRRETVDGTLRDNLAAGLNVTDGDRMRAMELTGFSSHYSELGIVLGSGGVELSGGQRSLLALTDALLRQPSILLLDEITAGVDAEALPKLVSLVKEYAKYSIVVCVTHDDSFDSVPHNLIEISRSDASSTAGSGRA